MSSQGVENLTVGNVHIWKLHLDQDSLPFAQTILSAEEWARAQRFHFERDRVKFIAAHCAQRIVLGKYLRLSPRDVQFCYNPAGKPFLAPAIHSARLHFNLSHSHELAVMGVVLDRQIGVDIEYVRPFADIDQLVNRFFSPHEQLVYNALPESQKLEAFYNCWTRKEAFIKAIGDGFTYPLNRLDISLVPGESACFVIREGDSWLAERWGLRQLVPEVGYTGAVAVEGQDPVFSMFTWNPSFSSDLWRGA